MSPRQRSPPEAREEIGRDQPDEQERDQADVGHAVDHCGQTEHDEQDEAEEQPRTGEQHDGRDTGDALPDRTAVELRQAGE